MADRQAGPRPTVVNGNGGIGGCRALLRRIHHHSPNSSQVVGFLTLALSGAVLLLLLGITVIGAALGFIAFAPLLLMTSPLWVPLVSSAFVLLAGAAAFSGTAVATAAGATWLYRYFTGLHPIGSDRVDYARSRIADTASHVKDYAREYGGYLQSRIKDAAPGA